MPELPTALFWPGRIAVETIVACLRDILVVAVVDHEACIGIGIVARGSPFAAHGHDVFATDRCLSFCFSLSDFTIDAVYVVARHTVPQERQKKKPNNLYNSPGK